MFGIDLDEVVIRVRLHFDALLLPMNRWPHAEQVVTDSVFFEPRPGDEIEI